MILIPFRLKKKYWICDRIFSKQITCCLYIILPMVPTGTLLHACASTPEFRPGTFLHRNDDIETQNDSQSPPTIDNQSTDHF